MQIRKVVFPEIREPIFEKKEENKIVVSILSKVEYKLTNKNILHIYPFFKKMEIDFKNFKALSFSLNDEETKLKTPTYIYDKQFRKVCKNCKFAHWSHGRPECCLIGKEQKEKIDYEHERFSEYSKKEWKIFKKYKNKTCEGFHSSHLETPFDAKEIISSVDLKNPSISLVKVKPCNEKYEKKTFLGILVDEWFADSVGISLNGETKILEIHSRSNPLIYIPEINSFVRGYASWWGRISSEKFKDISDEDIDNVWYVKLLQNYLK